MIVSVRLLGRLRGFSLVARGAAMRQLSVGGLVRRPGRRELPSLSGCLPGCYPTWDDSCRCAGMSVVPCPATAGVVMAFSPQHGSPPLLPHGAADNVPETRAGGFPLTHADAVVAGGVRHGAQCAVLHCRKRQVSGCAHLTARPLPTRPAKQQLMRDLSPPCTPRGAVMTQPFPRRWVEPIAVYEDLTLPV